MFRIFFGLLSLINALYYLPDFSIWYSAKGPTPLEAVATYIPSSTRHLLLAVSPPDGFYLVLLWLEIGCSVLVTLGLFTGPSLLALWLARLFLYTRNPALWHQVDILLRLYGTLLLFCPAGEMYSLDSLRKRRQNPGWGPRLFAPWAQRLIQLKLSLIYAEAFLGKIVALPWLDGSAVYFATHFMDGQRHLFPAFMDHLWVYRGLTYFTLLIEFSLMLLVWARPLRYPILVGGVLFHLGIDWFLHLDFLEYGAMLAYLTFIYPEDMERFTSWLNRKLRPPDFA